MADASVKQDADEATEGASIPAEAPASDLDASPAQAAGRRMRKPVQPLGGVVTRRTSARQVASSATRTTSETPRQTRGRQAALRRKAPSPTPAAGASPTETPQHRKGWKRKKSDAEDLSLSEPELEHDDSDTDPVWVPEAAKGVTAAAGGGAPPTAPVTTEPEPEAKPVRRGKGGKPAKTKPARPGPRKGAAKKPNGGKAEGGRAGGKVARTGIDLEPGSGSPESLQLKVELPSEGELAVRRDYTRRPGGAPAKKEKVDAVVAPLEIKADGAFKTGDYILAVADRNKTRPPIWRIEGRSLLQRFEAIESGDRLLYRNISSFSAWNPLEQAKYTSITVRVHSNSRSATVVEVLEIHSNTLGGTGGEKNGTEARNASQTVENLLEKYEVYLQTLLSHVLDPNFLSEVYKENDEYFLSNMQTIDGENEVRCTALKGARNWSSELGKAATSYPEVTVSDMEDTGTTCEGCGIESATHTADFSGTCYNKLDLTETPAGEEGEEKRTFRLCVGCAQPLSSYCQLYHYKFHVFQKCKKKVSDMQTERKVKESHIILEHCLQDDAWVNEMFADLQSLWQTSTEPS
ncbi:unnamed protein product [Ixodes hexagonus]